MSASPENLLFNLSLLLLFVSFVSLLLFLFYLHRSPSTAPNFPPGRMGYPMIGDSLEFLSTRWKGHPEKFIFDHMIKYSSKIFETSILGEPVVVFCGAIGNKFLFSNENKLVNLWCPYNSSKVISFSSLQTNSNEEAKKMRKLLLQFLKPEALQLYVGIMDTVAQRHFGSLWENKAKVAVYPLAKRLLIITTIYSQQNAPLCICLNPFACVYTACMFLLLLLLLEFF